MFVVGRLAGEWVPYTFNQHVVNFCLISLGLLVVVKLVFFEKKSNFFRSVRPGLLFPVLFLRLAGQLCPVLFYVVL